MMPSPRAPKIYRSEPGAPAWQPCQLRVLRVTPATACATALAGEGGGEAAAAARSALRAVAERGEGLVEVEVELVTGRTHQVRAQLSAEGFPLVGDALYDEPVRLDAHGLPPSAFVRCDMLALQSSRLAFAMPADMGGDAVSAQLCRAWWSDYIEKAES
jgi:hypothetical protein